MTILGFYDFYRVAWSGLARDRDRLVTATILAIPLTTSGRYRYQRLTLTADHLDNPRVVYDIAAMALRQLIAGIDQEGVRGTR